MGWSSSNAAVSAALKGAMRRVLFIVSGSESAKSHETRPNNSRDKFSSHTRNPDLKEYCGTG
ncbi:hypothetical protein APSETT444_010474 [Aspergillus pseudonomiae]